MNESVAPLPVSALRVAEWDAAYREYGPALLRFLRRLSQTRSVAEELVQETFVRAMQAANVPERAQELRPWLYRIATNVAIDRLRRDRRFSFIPFAGSELAPERDMDQIDLVRRALRAIPPEQATALVLRLHEGFGPHEIAEMLGVSEAAVRSRLVRGRRKFLETYERFGGMA